MREEIEVSNHLVRNLERISPDNSIFNNKSGRKAFLSLGQGNISSEYKNNIRTKNHWINHWHSIYQWRIKQGHK